MRLLGQKSREYKGKSYFKHWIVIPNTLLEKIGWKAGDELQAQAKNDRIVIEKKQK